MKRRFTVPKKSKSVPPKSQSAPSKSQKRSATSKPTPSLKGTRRDEKPALEEAPISPRILALSKNFKETDVVTYEECATPSQWAFNKIPPPLLPFVQNPTLGNLQRILADEAEDWWCYFHPIVLEQIRYLNFLRIDEDEWTRLEWPWKKGSYTNDPELPYEYYDQIDQALESLIEAHSASLLWLNRIKWKPIASRGRGDTGSYDNPYPRHGISIIWYSDLYSDFHRLKDAIVNRSALTETLDTLPEDPDSKKIANLKKEINWVLNEAGPDWSGLQKDIPKPDQSWPQSYNWDLPQFDEILRTFKATSLTTLGKKDGRPACLTYIIFGQLLDKKPSQIKNFVNAFRRSKNPYKDQ